MAIATVRRTYAIGASEGRRTPDGEVLKRGLEVGEEPILLED